MNWRFGCGWSTKAGKVYRRRVLSMTLLYMAILLGAASVVRHGHPQGWHLYFFAVAPAIPVLFILVFMGLYLRDETDEYMRTLTMRSLLAGTGAVMAALVVSDFLRSFTPTGEFPPFILFVVFFLGFGIAQGVQQLLNRPVGDE